jgi:D-amino peptidase
MRVLIAVDIEGISGIASSREYEHDTYGRLWMTEDTNAAVEGALAGGATEIVVSDTHGAHNDNLLVDRLHPAARFIWGGKNTPLYFMEGLTPETDLALLVGWHDKIGGPGLLSHTFVHKEVNAMRINGRAVGEVEIASLVAGHHDVAIGLVTGDNVTCAGALAWFGDVETACVKRAIDRYAAECLPFAEARRLIRTGAERAVARAGEFRPVRLEPPYTLEWDCTDHNIATILARVPGATHLEGNSVAYRHDDFLEMFNMLVTWRALLRTATVPN